MFKVINIFFITVIALCSRSYSQSALEKISLYDNILIVQSVENNANSNYQIVDILKGGLSKFYFNILSASPKIGNAENNVIALFLSKNNQKEFRLVKINKLNVEINFGSEKTSSLSLSDIYDHLNESVPDWLNKTPLHVPGKIE